MRSVQIRAHWHQHNVHRAPITLRCQKSIICYLCQCVISPTWLWDYIFYYFLDSRLNIVVNNEFWTLPVFQVQYWHLCAALHIEYLISYVCCLDSKIGIFLQHWILNIWYCLYSRYNIGIFVLTYLLPLAIMAACYIRMGRYLCHYCNCCFSSISSSATLSFHHHHLCHHLCQ